MRRRRRNAATERSRHGGAEQAASFSLDVLTGGRRGWGFCQSAPGEGRGGGGRGGEDSIGFLFWLRGGHHSSRFRVSRTTTWVRGCCTPPWGPSRTFEAIHTGRLRGRCTSGPCTCARLVRAHVHEVDSDLFEELVQGFCWLCLVSNHLGVKPLLLTSLFECYLCFYGVL